MIFLPKFGTVAVSARVADADKLRWYDAGSVQRTGSTITAWNDKGPNARHLGQVGTLPLPTYDTGSNRVLFDGSQVIGNPSLTYAQSLGKRLTDGGSIAFWAVAELDDTTQGQNLLVDYVMWSEGLSTSAGGNQRFLLRQYVESFGQRTSEVRLYNQRFSPAISAATGEQAALHRVRLLYHAWSDQTSGQLIINDGLFTIGFTPTVANWNNAAEGFFIGASATASAMGAGWKGWITEFYSTTNVNSAHRAAITAEMKTQYGF